MSSGAFQTFKYQLSAENGGGIHPIRLQPESVFGDNAEPAGGTTSNQRVRSAGSSRRSYGIHCRYMTIARPVGTAAGPYTGSSVTAKIPLLTPGAVTQFPVGSTVVYAGQTDWLVVSHTSETVK